MYVVFVIVNDKIELWHSIFLSILSRSVSLLTVGADFGNDMYIYIY